MFADASISATHGFRLLISTCSTDLHVRNIETAFIKPRASTEE
jgi:hypothetical protein